MPDQSVFSDISELRRDVKALQSQESGGGGGGTVTTASQPLAITSGNIALTATTTDDGGTIVKQSYPHTAQSGYIHVINDIVTETNFLIGTVTMLSALPGFPTGLVDGQRFRHNTYKSWFYYVSASNIWRQEGPGPFSGSFPTVSSGDNTACPKIEVKRVDRNNIVYFWDGANWLSTFLQTVPLVPVVQFTFGITTSTGYIIRAARLDSAYSVYVTDIEIHFRVNTTFSSTQKWATFISRNDSSGADNLVVNIDHWQTGRLANTNYIDTATINAVFTAAQAQMWEAGVTKTSTPGNLDLNGVNIHFRLVG